MTVEVTEVRNVVTVAPVTNAVTVSQANNVVSVEEGGGIFNGVVHTIGGTDHVLTGVLPLNPAAAGVLLTGTVGAEANPRLRIQTDRYELRTGGAATTGMDMRRQSLTQIDFVRDASGAPILRGRIEADTQPRWRITGGATGAYEIGLGGSTAMDTGIARKTDPGRLRVTRYIDLPNLLTPPTPTQALDADPPAYLYARASNGQTGNNASVYWMDDALTEIGPLGTLAGLLRRKNVPTGGFVPFNANAASNGLAACDAYGVLAGVTAYGTSSADAAYSPAVALTADIDATQTNILVSSNESKTGDLIIIDSEKMFNVGATAGQINVVRGVHGTTAASHLNGAAIQHVGGSATHRTQGVGDHLAVLELDTGTSANGDAGLEWPLLCGAHSAPMYVYSFVLRGVTNVRMFIGVTNQTLATMNASDDPAGDYYGLQFSTARGDTELQAVCKDGTTQNVQPITGAETIQFSAGQRLYVRVEYPNGTGAPEISVFGADWSQKGSTVVLSANAPPLSGPMHRVVAGAQNLAAESKRFRTALASMLLAPSVT